MKLSEPLIRLFENPIDAIDRALPDASSPLWDKEELRQASYPVHRLTRSILFEWLDKDWRLGGPTIVARYRYAPPDLTQAIYAYATRLCRTYPGAKLVRMVLAEMPPRTKIPAHVDNGLAVTAMHRCHVPIETNPNVHFYIDRAPYYLEPGVAYEFDNTRLHAVDNASDSRRVHLLCDFLPAALAPQASQAPRASS